MYQPPYGQYPPPGYGQGPPPQPQFQPYPYQPSPQPVYDPSRPTTTTVQSALFCHLPRPFGVFQQYIAPHEETLIVQNPCDFRSENVTIMNSRREPIFECVPIHKHGKECMIRSTSGQDLILIRHDPDKKLELSFELTDPSGKDHLAWLAAGLGDDPDMVNYTVFMKNKVNPQNPDEDTKMSVKGNFGSDHVDWTFMDTENRFAALRADFEQLGVSIPAEASGTRVAAGFDLAMIAGMQVVMDVHHTEAYDRAGHSSKKGKVGKGLKLGAALGKGLMKGYKHAEHDGSSSDSD